MFRLSLPPETWRRVDASMSVEELHARLGQPSIVKANEFRWRDKRLLGSWELSAYLSEESGKSLQMKFRYFAE